MDLDTDSGMALEMNATMDYNMDSEMAPDMNSEMDSEERNSAEESE